MSEDAPSPAELDAQLRDELATLRKRAYGRHADISRDPAAMARLSELEARVRPAMPAAASPDDVPGARAPHGEVLRDDVEGDKPVNELLNDDASPVDRPKPARAPQPLRWGVGAAVAIAAIAIVGYSLTQQPVSSPDATSDSQNQNQSPDPASTEGPPRYFYVADPRTESLQQLQLDPWPSSAIDAKSSSGLPPFPSEIDMDWAESLGEYYGWDLWIAGGGVDSGAEHCLVIVRGDETRGRCATPADQSVGILRVALSRDDIDPAEQPHAMAPEDRLRFWWRHSGVIDIVLGSFGRTG